MNRLCASLIAAWCLLAGRIDTANASCLRGFDWTGYASIPVWIHPDLARNLTHEDGTVWTFTEVRRELEYTLETLQENLPSGAPPVIVQSTASAPGPWDARIPGAVHIVPWLADCPGGI